jgi:hypothetical protein
MGHNPGLGDHIATVLLHLEGQGHPDALKDFFNPNIKSFKLLRVEEQGACYMSCIIWRVKNEVMVSATYTASTLRQVSHKPHRLGSTTCP